MAMNCIHCGGRMRWQTMLNGMDVRRYSCKKKDDLGACGYFQLYFDKQNKIVAYDDVIIANGEQCIISSDDWDEASGGVKYPIKTTRIRRFSDPRDVFYDNSIFVAYEDRVNFTSRILNMGAFL